MSSHHLLNLLIELCFLRIISAAMPCNAKVIGTHAVVREVIVGQLINIVQHNAVVVLLSVYALLIRNSVNTAAFPEAIAHADVRDILQDTVDSPLVWITVIASLRCKCVTRRALIPVRRRLLVD